MKSEKNDTLIIATTLKLSNLSEQELRIVNELIDGLLFLKKEPVSKLISSTSTNNQGKRWTDEANEELTKLYEKYFKPSIIAKMIGRTNGAVVSQLNKLGLINEDERLSFL
jgi:hypothetical protein